MAVDPTVLFAVALGLFLLILLVGIVVALVQVFSPFPTPEVTDMLYRFGDVKADSKTSTTLLVHTVMKKDGAAPTHAAMLVVLLASAKAVKDADSAAGWDVYAKAMGKALYDTYEMQGVSLEILVPDEAAASKNMQAAIYTRGCATKVLSFHDQMGEPQATATGTAAA